MILRQGDVALVKVKELPAGAIDITPAEGRIVLAFGEVTGHAHAIYEIRTKEGQPTVRLWTAAGERFLQVLVRSELRHEEHSTATLKLNVYWLPIQMEYAPAELRRVAD